MPTNREYLRTPIDAASTAGRFGRDFKLAARLQAKGLNPYRGRVPVFLVDLATKGNLIEPHGLHLRHSKLFNTQAAISAYAMHRDIEAFEAAYKPNNVVHIVLRPALNLQARTEGGQLLLDEDGRCPIANLRISQRAFNNCVQRAIAELERKQLLTPLLVARHVRPCQGGESFDTHAHVVVQMEPDKNWDVDDYLSKVFGSSRVWISSIMEPGEARSFSRTSNYPVWRLANQDWSEVNDENLKEFFEQSSGLRSVDALGPFRDFRTSNVSSPEAAICDDGDNSIDAEEADGETLVTVDALDAFASPDQPFEFEGPSDDRKIDRGYDSRDAAAAGISSLLASDPARKPILFGCHFAWIGLTRRFVAQVGNYTTFEDLQRHYDLDSAIAFARRHVEDTHAYLFKPVTPENRSEIATVQTESQAAGETLPSASEPLQQDKAAPFEKTGFVPQAASGSGRPTVTEEPLREGGSVPSRETPAGPQVAEGGCLPPAQAERLHDAGPATYPSKPETEPPASADLRDVERHRSMEVSNFDPAGITLELTVRSKRGPATATLRVGLPPATCQQWLQRASIAG